MAAAAAAGDLGAQHPVRAVGLGGDGAGVGRRGEAGPAGPRVELGLRGEELGAAAGAEIGGVAVGVPVGAREGPLGPLAPQHLVLLAASAPRAIRRRSFPLLSPSSGRAMRGSISCYAAAALASDRVLVTVTGPDRTGVTATLTGILSQQGATLHDIEQVVVQGQLTLCLLIGVPETRDVLKELLFAAKQLEMELDFKPVPADKAAPGPPARGAALRHHRHRTDAGGAAPARDRHGARRRGGQHREDRPPVGEHAGLGRDPRAPAARPATARR